MPDETNATTPSTPDPTSSDAARQNMLNSYTARVTELNIELENTFTDQITNFNEQTAAHRPMAMPTPPNSWRLVDNKGVNVTMAQDGPPIQSKVPVYVPPPPPAPGTIDMGELLGNGWYAVGPNDRKEPGDVVTMPNGVKLLRIRSPFGEYGGYYVPLSGV